ncbi:MAG: glycosyltransferase [bacterium]
MNKPLVSLLIPTYNSVKYLALALDSAFAQTYDNIEIIVHDDASTDETPELLSKYRNLASVRLIRTDKNHGMVNGWNYLTKLARGKYIKFLASDDLLAPTCIEELVTAMEKHPHAVIATCRRQVIDESGNVLNTLRFADKDQLVDGKVYAHQVLTTIRENKIGEPSAVLYPTKLVNEAGEYDPQFSQFTDFEYWLRLLEFGDLVFVNKPLCSFRTHSSSNSSKAILDGRFIDEIFLLIDKYYTSPHFQKIFSLSENDQESVIKQKTLDTLKNIKDLILSGRIIQARRYYLRLVSHVEKDYMFKVTLSHIFKR